MDKIRISAVKYANTYPFIYGLLEGGIADKVTVETDHPSDCAAKLISGKVDIGLIPVAALPSLKESHILSDYCIGANGNVRTVLLLSNCPLADIHTIYLDYRSRSSVTLIKVLARYSWKRDFRWINTSKGFDFLNIGLNEGVVLIGDQCFEYENSFRYKVDLAFAWKEYSGLPFVFAAWVSNKIIENKFLDEFNNAMKLGVNNIDAVVEKFGQTGTITGEILKNYLLKNIDFNFNPEKKEALKLFLELTGRL